MQLTIRHYSPLDVPLSGPLRSTDAWEELRESEGAFGLPKDAAVWRERAAKAGMERRADAIVSLGYNSITSHGVGCGWLEYALSSRGVRLTCTELAPTSLATLAGHFTECSDFRLFNITDQQWPNPDDLHLLHRLDAEATDDEWRSIFANMEQSGITKFVFVPSEVLTPGTLARYLAVQLKSVLLRRKLTFCGWFRSEAAFRKLFPAGWTVEKMEFAGLVGFILTK
jgi:hypothetical protein